MRSETLEPSAAPTAAPAAKQAGTPHQTALFVQFSASCSDRAEKWRRTPFLGRSERDVVVEILRRGGRRARRLLGPRRGARARTAAEHLHVVGDDLRGPPVVAVPVLPLAGAQPPLDVHLRALAQVFRRDLGKPAEHRDVVPLRALLLLARLPILPGLGGGDAQVRDGGAARHVAGLGIGAQVTDQNDFIDASGHRSSCLEAGGLWIRGVGPDAALYDVAPPMPRPFLAAPAGFRKWCQTPFFRGRRPDR